MLRDWLFVPLVLSVPVVLLVLSDGIDEFGEVVGFVVSGGEFAGVWLPGVSDEAGGVVDGLD